ncbi:MAG: hypothetical protein CL670_05800 [Balneola sp.]|jgi:hypothetical protein|nr:hypothetical protein [Balneola sp.]MBE78649.1 hypothetical protein [Balneola sp.]|tara:strand:+ start:89 stop:646 length:558 start_codon:yes stop_codon:yes gene_type:complete
MENKSRRNLLTLSLLIIVNYYIGISIDEINILGNSLTIEEPEIIGYLVIVAWVYFLFWFYQTTMSKKDLGIRGDFEKRMIKYTKPNIIKEMNRLGYDVYSNIEFQPFNKFKKSSFFKYRYPLQETNLYNESETVDEIPLNFRIFIIPFLKSSVSFVFNNKAFSEYFIPFILAFGTLIYICLEIFT